MTEQKMFDWLKADIEKVDKKVDQMNDKIDEILKFKWTIIGGSLGLSAFLTIIVQVLGIYYSAKH